MTAEEIASLVRCDLAAVPESGLRDAFSNCLIAPRQHRRFCSFAAPPREIECWSIAEFTDAAVAFVFSADQAVHSFPWGLVFRSGDDCGNSGSWYSSLQELLVDSGYFE